MIAVEYLGGPWDGDRALIPVKIRTGETDLVTTPAGRTARYRADGSKTDRPRSTATGGTVEVWSLVFDGWLDGPAS